MSGIAANTKIIEIKPELLHSFNMNKGSREEPERAMLPAFPALIRQGKLLGAAGKLKEALRVVWKKHLHLV
jgi:hypothetical protein